MPHATQSNQAVWQTLISNALTRRVDPRRLEDALSDLAKMAEPPTRLILDTVLNFHEWSAVDRDSLIIKYVGFLLDKRYISSIELLEITRQHSTIVKPTQDAAGPASTFLTFEEKVFTTVRAHINDMNTLSPMKLHDLTLILTRWLHSIANVEISKQVELGPAHTITGTVASMYEALALLVYAVFSNKHFSTVETQKWWVARRVAVITELDRYESNVLQLSHSPVAGYLHNLTLQRPFLEVKDDDRPVFAKQQVLAAFPPTAPVTTRAGLYVYLAAYLELRILPNDASMRNHLLVRYQDDPQRAVVSLIIATFDVWSKSKSAVQDSKLTTSFICNKLPLLIAPFATLITAHTVESCVSMALLSLDTPANLAQDQFLRVKQDFLHACLLHGLVTENTISTILANGSISPPKTVRYDRATLVAQCSTNLSKLDSLLSEMDHMRGNAGAIAYCITDLVATACTTKDIMMLKTICMKLLRNLSQMDIVMQYAQCATFLTPICQLLNDWTPDQDQTDFQPPYEDFAVIFLFLISMVHRYQLSRLDLGISNTESFVGRMITGSPPSLSASDMTVHSTQLSHWIQGLYATDEGGEIVGITDEVYSVCPPQSFYIMVPTILEQTLIACKSRVLPVAMMKAGLEFLLEPFLLPSLIPGLLWAINSSWKDNDDTAIRVVMLEKLIKFSGTSSEAKVMHNAALNIVAIDVDRGLKRALQTTSQKKKEIATLLQTMQPIVAKSIVHSNPPTAGKLEDQLRACVKGLIAWTTGVSTALPPPFSAQIMRRSCASTGPQRSLDYLVTILEENMDATTGPSVLDICAALMCAPESGKAVVTVAAAAVDLRSGMPESLHLMIDNVQGLLKLPAKRAEAVVRLYQAVKAQSALSALSAQLDVVTMALPAQTAADSVMQGLGLSTEASVDATAAMLASTTDAEFQTAALGLGDSDLQSMVADPNMMDMGQSTDIFNGLGMELSADATQLSTFGSTGVGDSSAEANTEDDIFADLGLISGFDDFT